MNHERKNPDHEIVRIEVDIPRWLAKEFDYVFSAILAGDHSLLKGLQAQREVGYEAGISGLEVIVDAIRRHPGTGQAKRLVRFLGGLYNGERFRFDLTDLRALDTKLSQACLAVLAQDTKGVSEIHTWGVVMDDELNGWLQEYGLYYEAQQQRVSKILYKNKFGEDGHPDEGMQA